MIIYSENKKETVEIVCNLLEYRDIIYLTI